MSSVLRTSCAATRDRSCYPDRMAAAASSKPENRIAKIADPRQRAVASRIGTICDWFCADIVAHRPKDRLVAGDKAGPGDDAWRLRNIARKFAVGAAVAMLEDLGVPLRDQHGRAPKGRTEIEELKPLHPASILQFKNLFRATLLDKGDFGVMIADRYAAALAQARAEVEAAEGGAAA